MSGNASWPVEFRTHYLREVWRRVGLQAKGQPIAVYGAGRHTRFFLEVVAGVEGGARVECILDDNAGGQPAEILGIPVRTPASVAPSSVALVVVSSDSIEARLAERARAWAGGRGGAPVVRLYEGLPPGPYADGGKQSGSHWGTGAAERNGHLPMSPEATLLRIGAVRERGAGERVPVPPGEIRAGYSANDEAGYLSSGRAVAKMIRTLVGAHGLPESELKRVLDWGCSTGRVIRHFADLAEGGSEVWGADICARSINWAQENLSPPLKFFQCMTRPPLALPDASIDLVYAISVFSHLRELVDSWLMELRRVVRPGGLVFVTILDEHSWEKLRQAPGGWLAQRCVEADLSRPMEDDFVACGTGADPITFWHTRGVRSRWSFAFEVVHVEPELVPMQTGVLLRRR